ncbi:MAG: HvfC/BufC family peptide modification chaperone [Gammaproteobacteria bacterium]
MSLRDAPRLETLERWMQAVVTHPSGAEAGLRSPAARRLLPQAARRPESVILPSKALSAAERLDIYAHAYYARLVEVLENEYPTTRQILGEDEFDAACRRFIRHHPSRERTLNRLSVKFPGFLARTLPRNHRNGLAADVACIERAMEDVFDAPRAEPLTAADIAAIAPAEWQRRALPPIPALRLLKLRYPANDYMNAVRAKRRPRIPRPRATFAIVWRRGYQVYRRDQEPGQFQLLQSLASGRTLAQAVLAGIAGASGSADRHAARLRDWFREWAAEGIFRRD